MNRLSKAVSWVELIVLLSLACIVVAILFPVFTHRHRVAQRASCLSNLRALGLGLEQYVQDNDMLYPVGPGTHRGGGWAGAVFPYVKSAAVYDCPDDPTEPDRSVNPPRSPVSYAFNQFLAQPNKEKIADVSYSGLGGASRKVKAPSLTIMLFEVSGSRAVISDPAEGGRTRDRTSLAGDGLTLLSYDGANAEQAGSRAGGATPGGARYATGQLAGRNRVPQPAQWMNEPRHGAGANYLFADAHVRYFNTRWVSVAQNVKGKAFWAQK